MKLLGTYDSTPIRGMTLSADGNTAYVVGYDYGLRIIDVSNGSSPTLLGTVDTIGFADSVTLSADGERAYLATVKSYGYFNSTDESGLNVIDVSTSSNPTLLGTYNSISYTKDVALSSDGQTAYVVDKYDGLQIIDVSLSSNPTLLSAFGIPDAYSVVLSSDNNTAYVTYGRYGSGGLKIIDVSSVRNPNLLGTYEVSNWAFDVALSSDGQTAYVVGERSGLHIIDVSLGSNPTQLGGYKTSKGNYTGIVLSSDNESP